MGDGVLASDNGAVFETSRDVVGEVGVDGWNYPDMWWDVGYGA